MNLFKLYVVKRFLMEAWVLILQAFHTSSQNCARNNPHVNLSEYSQ